MVSFGNENLCEGGDSMTRNQIDYWKLQETKRANAENEALGKATLAETNRANVAKETENYRSNTAREAETRRHDIEGERVNWATLAESGRHNQRDEELKARANDVSRMQYVVSSRRQKADQTAAERSASAKQRELDLRQRELEANIPNREADTALKGITKWEKGVGIVSGLAKLATTIGGLLA